MSSFCLEGFIKYCKIHGDGRNDIIEEVLFQNRIEAGRKLALELEKKFPSLKKEKNAIVLALPRGGVPVGFEIATHFHFPLDLIVTHKLGAPGNPELAIGAVAEDGSSFLNPEFSFQVSREYVKRETQHQVGEIRKRIQKYRQEKPLPDLSGKTVILVDDGIATGNTMQAAIRMVKSKAKSTIVATPVLPPDTRDSLEREVPLVYLATPEPFFAIGRFYIEFEQLEDREVLSYLEKARFKK